MNTNEKSSDKVIEYVETRILAGKLTAGDRLPAERELAQTLNVSRTAVREGIRLLEVIGIVESRRGSGNYIAQRVDQTLEQVLTMMYALDDMRYDEIREFRYAVERQALVLAVRNADAGGKRALQRHLDGLLHAETEEEQADVRRQIRDESEDEFEAFQNVHRRLVEAVVTGDLAMGKDALEEHFTYIARDFDT